MLVLLASAASAQTLQYRAPDGTAYYSQPDTGVVARAQAALDRNPAMMDTLIALGLAQSGIRAYREAIQTFSRGLRDQPDNPILYRWRGHRYISVREFDRAVADLVNGIGRDPENYGILYQLGVAHYVRGEFDSAASAFARAKTHPPNITERLGSYDWLWSSLMRAGRRAEAEASIADLTPADLAANATIAYAQRLRLYRGWIRPDSMLGPSDTSDIQVATLSYGIGNWYLLRGDTARAREYFRRSVASGGWPAFGFIASEVELRRLGAGTR